MLAYYGIKTEHKVSSDDPVKVTLSRSTFFFLLFVILAGKSSHLMDTGWGLRLMIEVHRKLLCVFKIMICE